MRKTNQIVLASPEHENGEGEKLKSWALVELFGHQRIVGFLSEQSFGTGVLFRVDVPDLTKEGKIVRSGFTRYFGISSIYSITPIDEEAVRELLPVVDGSPSAVRPYTLPRREYRDEDEGEMPF